MLDALCLITSIGIKKEIKGKKPKKWALVAHTCNPRYLGGRDQEDYTRPAWAKSFRVLSPK
jgi:hypothetical protein